MVVSRLRGACLDVIGSDPIKESKEFIALKSDTLWSNPYILQKKKLRLFGRYVTRTVPEHMSQNTNPDLISNPGLFLSYCFRSPQTDSPAIITSWK